jgi:hypothetical protein
MAGMNSKELTFTADSQAFLIAGRQLRGEVDAVAFDKLCTGVDSLADEMGKPVVVVPAGDFTETGVPISELASLVCAVGLLVQRTDSYSPDAVSYDDLTAALADAASLPWAAIRDLAGPDQRLADDIAVHLTACGPLAGGMLGYGVLVTLREEEDMTWDEDDEQNFLDVPDGPAATVPGLDLVRGNMMGQEPQYDAVYGVQVVRALYDGPIPVEIDISGASHQARLDRLGDLAGQAAYYLIGHYD